MRLPRVMLLRVMLRCIVLHSLCWDVLKYVEDEINRSSWRPKRNKFAEQAMSSLSAVLVRSSDVLAIIRIRKSWYCTRVVHSFIQSVSQSYIHCWVSSRCPRQWIPSYCGRIMFIFSSFCQAVGCLTPLAPMSALHLPRSKWMYHVWWQGGLFQISTLSFTCFRRNELVGV